MSVEASAAASGEDDDDLPSSSNKKKSVKSLNCPKIVFLNFFRRHFATRQKHGKLKSCHTNIRNYFRERNYMFVASFFLFAQQISYTKKFSIVCRNFTTKHGTLLWEEKFLISMRIEFGSLHLLYEVINDSASYTEVALADSDFTTVNKLKQVQFFTDDACIQACWISI